MIILTILRFINCEIRNYPQNNLGTCVIGTGHSTEYNEFINLDIHDLPAYGFYMGGNYNLIDNCTVHGCKGFGIHLYSGYPGPIRL